MRAFTAPAAAPASIPLMPGIDHTLAFFADPYRFISRQCDALGSNAVRLRLMGRTAIALRGAAGAELFYDASRFRRAGAAPEPLRATLFGKGGVQSLDGPAHLQRRQLFLRTLDTRALLRIAAVAEESWWRLMPEWIGPAPRPLYLMAQAWLGDAVFRWAGLGVGPEVLARRTHQLVQLFDGAASGPGAHVRARLARSSLEHWLARVVQSARDGRCDLAEHSPALAAALWQDEHGRPLPARVAAVELLNLMRPVVAVSVFVVHIAHALHRHPFWAEAVGAGREASVQAFVQEVRRCYPFFPAVAARVREAFAWQGLHFPQGCLTLLDLWGTNHDARLWNDPFSFRPERFLQRDADAWDLVPQGGGPALGHRCPGEAVTVELMKLATRLLSGACRWRPATQDLEPRMDRLPAVPRHGFLIADFESNRPASRTHIARTAIK